MKRLAAKYLYRLDTTAPVVNGFVELEDDGTVIRTGVCADPASEPVFYEGAIAPGFVNAHCHVELSYMKGMFRKGTGMAGFIDQINELRDTKSMEEKVRDLTVAMDSLWEQGVVAMADISNCADSFAVKARHPMYTRTFLEVFGTEPEDCGAVMDGVRKLKEVADGFGINAAPTPHACYTMSPELVTAVSVEGLRSGFLSFHSEETEEEEEMLKYGSGKMWENRVKAGMSVPPVTGKSSLLYFIDRLLAGHSAPFDEHILLVHECCMDQEGVDAVKAVMNHPFVAVCPLSNLFIHNALPPVDLMRRNGLKVCVGTDSLSSNDDLNIVDELYCLQRNFPEVPLGELLTWASRNGAEFLARPEFGTLEPGKRPGLVLIDNLDADGRLTAAS
ncbi:MAG: amidohydrolase family protein [Bacteroidales bacterium]|nr:amidohydrolase family protein [Bacteroidales bacterium]